MSKKRKHGAAANTRAGVDSTNSNTRANLFHNGVGSGSLTSALFGESTDVPLTDNDLFSSTQKFDTAIKERIHDNANQAAAARREEFSSCNTKVTATTASTTTSTAEDIIAQRRKQAESSFIHVITLQAPFPVNAKPDDDTHSDDDNEIEIPIDVKVDEIADTVRANGFAVVTNVLSKDLLDTISSKARDIETQVCTQLDKANISWKCNDQPSTFTFHEVASRCKGRMDVRYGTHEEPFVCTEIVNNPSLSPIINSLLGGGNDDSPQHAPTLLYAGLIFSLAGSDDQPWHQDGMPLFPEINDLMLPPYAINIFLPLQNDDASIEAGPTEFIPASHVMEEATVLETIDECCTGNTPVDNERVSTGNADSHANVVASEESNEREEAHPGIISPRLNQGDALLYDYRVCHRGTSNLTQQTRRILYLMYARPWFKEHLNFGSKRLFNENESES